MRGRVILFLVVLLSFAPSLLGQCNQELRYSGQFRTTAFDVSLDTGGLLWVATGYGVTLLEHVAGSEPRVIDSIALPGSTRVVLADGNGVAYAGSGSTLQVLRREGGSLRLIRSVEASGTINDVALSTYLFVATSAGIDHFAIFDPESPARTNVSLFTTLPNVTSLAVAQSNLYAADGDDSVEVYSIATPSLPQRTGSLEAMPLAAFVSSSASGLIFVSDRFGQNTDVFFGTTRIARYPFGSTSVAGPAGQVHFVSGSDRTVRAIDISTPARLVTLLEERLSPTGGSDNSLRTIRRSGNTLYVAAGDIGLAIYDISAFARPYPMVSYRGDTTTGVQAAGDRAWFSDPDGGISERRIVASGLSLDVLRTWSAGPGAVVRDVSGDLLLTSSGSSVTLWSLSNTAPASTTTVSFPDSVADAVIHDGGIVARLASGAIWKSSLPTPQPAGLAPMAHLARSGTSLALAEVRSDGTTTLHYYPTGDLTAEPQRVTFPGAATGSIALDSARAAVFTFEGISVVDLSSGTVRLLSGSNRTIPRQLLFSGDDLLVLGTNRLDVYPGATVFAHEHSLPLDAGSMDASGTVAVLAGFEGTTAISFMRELPRASTPFSNRYYTKVVSGGERIYLFSRDSVDIYSLVADTPSFISRIDGAGIIDIAATPDTLLTLSGNGTIAAWSPWGAPLGQTRLADESAEPLSITAVGNAAWVSVAKGCTGGVCQRETVVMDSRTLATTATMSGGIDDVTIAGNRAYALTSLPDMIRVIDVTNPLLPTPLIERPRPPAASSIAHENGTVHVLGQRLYAYSATTLAPAGERLESVNTPGAQIVRIEGSCAIVMRAGQQPRIHTLPGWTPGSQPMPLPSALRSVASSGPRFFLLTDNSLEVWSATAPEAPSRRRAVR